MVTIQVNSISQLLDEVKKITMNWRNPNIVWFRGEPKNIPKPLIPKVFRYDYPENDLLQRFRQKAPTLCSPDQTLPRSTDEWLFLAQHMGLPTRLLDWTESLLVATYFSIQEADKDKGSVLWMLHPVALNRLDNGSGKFDLTWYSPELDLTSWIKILLEPDKRIKQNKLKNSERKGPKPDFLSRLVRNIRSTRKFHSNPANLNIRGAWENDKVGTSSPVAIYPQSIHPRMAMQKSCFTIHRRNHPSLQELLSDKALVQFVFPDSSQEIQAIKHDLKVLGITTSTVFPDIVGLAKELDDEYKGKGK